MATESSLKDDQFYEIQKEKLYHTLANVRSSCGISIMVFQDESKVRKLPPHPILFLNSRLFAHAGAKTGDRVG